jgi:predicted GNAT family N-acyltransferase
MSASLIVRLGDWAQLRAHAELIRMAVFVQEQGFAVDTEIDEWDAQSVHAVAYDPGDAPVATGRLKPDCAIGRMAVLPLARERGAGSAVMHALVAAAQARGDTALWLSAQAHAIAFYARHGFVAEGALYLEEHVPHQRMVRALVPPVAQGRA